MEYSPSTGIMYNEHWYFLLRFLSPSSSELIALKWFYNQLMDLDLWFRNHCMELLGVFSKRKGTCITMYINELLPSLRRSCRGKQCLLNSALSKVGSASGESSLSCPKREYTVPREHQSLRWTTCKLASDRRDETSPWSRGPEEQRGDTEHEEGGRGMVSASWKAHEHTSRRPWDLTWRRCTYILRDPIQLEEKVPLRQFQKFNPCMQGKGSEKMWSFYCKMCEIVKISTAYSYSEKSKFHLSLSLVSFMSGPFLSPRVTNSFIWSLHLS